MLKVDAIWNLTDLRELGNRYPEVTKQETVRVMDVVVPRLETKVVEKTPRGVGGDSGLAGSIAGEVVSFGAPVRGLVFTPLDYGIVIEEGRRPGQAMPPVDPIALWAQRKLGVAADEARSVGFAIARKIAVEGFEGAKMFEEAWSENWRWAQDELYTIGERIAEKVF